MLRWMLVAWSISNAMQVMGQAPKYSNEFMNIGVGARALSLSGAYASLTADATSPYWNPAATVMTDSLYDLSMMHAAYFGNLAQYDYVGAAIKVDSSHALGLGMLRFGIENIPDTRYLYDANGVLNYDNIRFFSAVDYAFLLNYAQKVNVLGGLSVGGNVKVIHRKVGKLANAWGFGIDIAVRKQWAHTTVSWVGKDITGTYNAWSHNIALLEEQLVLTGNTLPQNQLEVTLPKCVWSVAHVFDVKANHHFTMAMDILQTFDGERNTLIQSAVTSLDPSLGMMYDFKKRYYIRTGVGQFQQKEDFEGKLSWEYRPTFGIGFNWNIFQLDYAMMDLFNQSDALSSHVFSLHATFNQIHKQ